MANFIDQNTLFKTDWFKDAAEVFICYLTFVLMIVGACTFLTSLWTLVAHGAFVSSMFFGGIFTAALGFFWPLVASAIIWVYRKVLSINKSIVGNTKAK